MPKSDIDHLTLKTIHLFHCIMHTLTLLLLIITCLNFKRSIMKFTFTPLDEANARTIQSWNYEDPYNIYNWAAEDDISEMLDRRSPHYAVKDEHGDLIGFFAC